MFLNNKIKKAWLAGMMLSAAGWFAPLRAAEGLFPNPTALAPPLQATKMPEFDFVNLASNGGVLKSSEMKGKVIIIRFWATW